MTYFQTCQPHGLSEDRKLYLYEKIRQYCSDATKDQVCSKPTHSALAKDRSTSSKPIPPPQENKITRKSKSRKVESDDEYEPQPKKTRKPTKCSKCSLTGHNTRQCHNNNNWILLLMLFIKNFITTILN